MRSSSGGDFNGSRVPGRIEGRMGARKLPVTGCLRATSRSAHQNLTWATFGMTRTVEDLHPSLQSNNPAVRKRSLLMPSHSAAASAHVTIAHAQLRHLISCPAHRGTVYYVSGKSIVERDVLSPNSPPRCIIDLDFSPTCFAATAVGSTPNSILFAAGGSMADIHLSLHSFPPSTHTSSPSTHPSPSQPKLIWRYASRLPRTSEIVNSILFTPASLTDDTPRSAPDMRMVVSGNDATVKFFDVGMQPSLGDDKRLQECGCITLETPGNHMSLSPNGRTLLCVGDTPKAYLFNVSPGSTVTFSPLATYILPTPPHSASLLTAAPSPSDPPPNFRSIACFATAWSSDGLKFAVASQEGQLCVWDVRSAEPLFTFWTAYRRNSTMYARGRRGEWEWEDLGGHMRLSDDGTNNSPDSGIRNLRFSAGDGGRECIFFTEHTTNLHVMDARTFDLASHSVIPFPDLSFLPPSSGAATQPARSPSPPSRSPLTPTEIGQTSPVIIPMFRSRSRSRSRSPPGWVPSLFDSIPPTNRGTRRPVGVPYRPRSRSPTVIVVPPRRSLTPPPVHVPPLPGPPDEANITWRGHPRDGFERVVVSERLDADGDVIEDAERNWTEVVTGGMRLPRMRRVTMTQRTETVTAPLESVAEGGEPLPLRPTHIAGLCLDPSGGWVYIASEHGIVEWRVREREEGKTCWGGGAWA